LRCSKNKYNELEFNKLNLNAGQIKTMPIFSDLSDEEINAVLNYLIVIAKLEIAMQEKNNIK
jgi:hypothetical protein